MKNNQYFTIQQAELGKKKVNPIFALALALALVFLIGGEILAEILLLPIQFLQKSHDLFLKNIFFGTSELLYNLVAVFLLFFWVVFMEKRPFLSIGFTKKRALEKYVKGIALGFLLVSISPIVIVLTGYGTLELQNIDNTLIWTMIIYFLVYIIQGAGEEIIFRGWLLPVIALRTNKWFAVLISSLFFGSLHLFNPGMTIYSLLGIILFGIFAGIYVLKEGNLWIVCGIHSIWNWALLCVYDFGLLEGKTREASLFQMNLTGPEAITGGIYGGEASIITHITVVFAALLILRKIHKNRNIKPTVITETTKG